VTFPGWKWEPREPVRPIVFLFRCRSLLFIYKFKVRADNGYQFRFAFVLGRWREWGENENKSPPSLRILLGPRWPWPDACSCPVLLSPAGITPPLLTAAVLSISPLHLHYPTAATAASCLHTGVYVLWFRNKKYIIAAVYFCWCPIYEVNIGK